ncbi:PA2169 family four-helix-bundle protein [Rhodobacteraceae bacterium CCMM004]|nr:PA2169 family four-helix-bundle protein [Rhodobacteraceae bacterium CCMM004]
MSQRLNNLNKIISVLWGGAESYRSAARKTSKAELEKVFVEHAELREHVARELSRMVDEAGGEPASAAPTEKLHGVKTAVGAIFGDTETNLVHGLEEHEDRTLTAFREAIHHPDSSRDEAMLREFMQEFEKSHARMKEHKEEV